MERRDTFGVHFVMRRMPSGKNFIYARIVINGTASELAVKQQIEEKDWNGRRGMAHTRTAPLQQLNSYPEEVRGKLFNHFQRLRLGDEVITPDMVKRAFLNQDKKTEDHSLLWLVNQHNTIMKTVLSHGTLKNYFTTERVFFPVLRP